MAPSDKDYRLTHEQLIKVVKIMLHLMNCQDLKNVSEREVYDVKVKEMFKQADSCTRSQMEEVSQLVHSVH